MFITHPSTRSRLARLATEVRDIDGSYVLAVSGFVLLIALVALAA